MATTYRTRIWGDTYEVTADWAQASSPVIGPEGGRQVADFRHRPEAAMREMLTQIAILSGDDPEEDEDVADDIERAVARMKSAE